jgi:uncharacterized protein
LTSTYDSAKDQVNREKHGLSLGEAARLEWDMLQAKADTRRDYGEARQIGYAPIDGRLYCVMFVEREGAMRIISFRKANSREVQEYEEKID